MYQGIDLIQKEDGKYYILIKLSDGIVIEKQISEKALESLIAKYRMIK